MARPQVSSEIYPIHLSPEQLNKLKNELEVVQGNMKVLSEMLTEMKPGQEHRDDWELLVELQATCQTMQKRIVELIEKVANEEVTNELLRINDELNNLFMRFERYDKKRGGSGASRLADITLIASTSANSHPVVAQNRAQGGQPNNVPSLIDFTDDEPDGLSKPVNDLSLSPPVQIAKGQAVESSGDQDFDVFAQLRSNTSATPTASQDLLLLDPVAAPTMSVPTVSAPSTSTDKSQVSSVLQS